MLKMINANEDVATARARALQVIEKLRNGLTKAAGAQGKRYKL
jgi:hypothetical protein